MKSEVRNSELSEAKGFAVRGLNPEVIGRLKDAVRDAGGNKAVAQRSGVPLSTLNGALAGKSEPRASAMAAIATATGRSLDWLFFSAAAAPASAPGSQLRSEIPLNVAMLTHALTLVDEWLVENKRKMTPEKKSEVVGTIYQFLIEDAALGKEPIDRHRVAQFLRLVA